MVERATEPEFEPGMRLVGSQPTEATPAGGAIYPAKHYTLVFLADQDLVLFELPKKRQTIITG
ncbi:hypothetical protein GCM10009850_121120 [Nonomuraea monospora]|uniref:Uncharacterized protein n=1 Tax=Nonomuraea monospora TaxID=568818 RepID=A0ABN3D4P7_9ACTN